MPPSPAYINLLLFLLGLLVIIKGSDLFLDNAIWIAHASGMSQIVIGATVVSACTTLPEVVSSCTASLKGFGDMALGNAIGSVICNTGIILAILLWSVTATINRRSLALRGGFLLVLLFLVLVFSLPSPLPDAGLDLYLTEGTPIISRLEAFLLLIGVLFYLGINYHDNVMHVAKQREQHKLTGLAHTHVLKERNAITARDWQSRLAWFGCGAVSVAMGAFLLVEYGQRLARNMGLSEAVVSLLFIAFGTSLPELFTAISAIRKKAEDISVGNILGANVLNIALATGAAGFLQPLTIVDRMLFCIDMPVAIVLCTIVTVGGLMSGKLGRKMGVLLFITYLTYLLSMVLLGRLG